MHRLRGGAKFQRARIEGGLNLSASIATIFHRPPPAVNNDHSLTSTQGLQSHVSFSHKDLGVTQSLNGNVYKVVNYEGRGSVHMLAEFKLS